MCRRPWCGAVNERERLRTMRQREGEKRTRVSLFLSVFSARTTARTHGRRPRRPGLVVALLPHAHALRSPHAKQKGRHTLCISFFRIPPLSFASTLARLSPHHTACSPARPTTHDRPRAAGVCAKRECARDQPQRETAPPCWAPRARARERAEKRRCRAQPWPRAREPPRAPAPARLSRNPPIPPPRRHAQGPARVAWTVQVRAEANPAGFGCALSSECCAPAVRWCAPVFPSSRENGRLSPPPLPSSNPQLLPSSIR